MTVGQGLARLHGLGFIIVVLSASVTAAPRPDEGVTEIPETTPSHLNVVMVTQSPAQAIEDAIRYDPDVASALQSNDTQLYLLKSITYTNGTAEDLGLPNEQLLPEGAPDRVRVADKIVYPSPLDSPSTNDDTAISIEQPSAGINATLQLVPVSIN